MKLDVRVVPGNEAERLLAADETIGGAFDVRRPFWVEVVSREFERMVQLTRRSDGLWVTPEVTFTKPETVEAPFAVLEARKVLALSERDVELNAEHIESQPLRGKVKGGVRLMDRLVASKGKVPVRSSA